MDRDEALELIPANYATALRLRDQGAGGAAIAAAVGVEVEAVTALLRLAEAKLARYLDKTQSGEEGRSS